MIWEYLVLDLALQGEHGDPQHHAAELAKHGEQGWQLVAVLKLDYVGFRHIFHRLYTP